MRNNSAFDSSIKPRTKLLHHAVAATVATFMPAMAAQAQQALQAPDAAAAAPAEVTATGQANSDEGRPARPWYLGFSLGRADHGPFDQFDSGHAGASTLVFGYRFTPHWAVEVSGNDLSVGRFLIDALFSTRTGGPTYHLGTAIVGEWPLGTHAALRGRLGIGSTTIQSEVSEAQDRDISDPSIGVGLTLGPVGRIAFKLDATRYSRSRVTTRMVGAELRF